MPQQPSDLINPIIGSIMESARQRMEAQKLAQQAEQFKAEQALRQQHQGMLEKQIDKEHEIALARLENDRKFREAQQEQMKIEAIGHLANIAQIPGADLSGFITPAQGTLPGVIGAERPSTLSIPGTNLSFPNFLPNASEIGKAQVARAAALAGETAKAQASAQEPYKIAAEDRKYLHQSKLKETEFAARLQNTVQQGKNQAEAAKIHGEYLKANALIGMSSHLKGIAMMNSLGFEENQTEGAKQIVDGVFDGQIDPGKLTQPRRKLMEAYASGTGELASLPLDFKSYKARLDNMSSLQGLVDEYRMIANNYSRDSPGSLLKGNVNFTVPIIGTHGFTTAGSELSSKLASVKSEGGTIAAFFDKMTGRRSEAEVLRETSGWFNPAFTKQQNIDMIEQHVQRLQRDVRSLFTGMSSERINKVLGDRGVTDFGAFQHETTKYKRTSTGPNGHKIGSDNGKDWYDVETGRLVTSVQ